MSKKRLKLANALRTVLHRHQPDNYHEAVAALAVTIVADLMERGLEKDEALTETLDAIRTVVTVTEQHLKEQRVMH